MIAGHTDLRLLTPPEVARRLRVTPERVIGWIRAGKLRAINLSEGTKRPRFRIEPADLDRFLLAREVTSRPRPTRRRKEQAVKHYFRGGGK